MGKIFAQPENSDVLINRSAISIYYVTGFCFALFFAYIITDKTFNFFAFDDWFSISYNFLFLSLLEGKQSIPLKYINLEGAYLPDGTAYMYYGIGPALLRVFFHPFMDLQQVPVARFVVWSLVSISGFVCQNTLLFVVRNSKISTPGLPVVALFLGGIAIWFASPLLILASGASIYHEPIALAFLCTVVFVRAAISLTFPTKNTICILWVCGIAAAIAVHARPHVAVALYLGTAGLWIWAMGTVWADRETPYSGPLDERFTETPLKSLCLAGLGICVILGLAGLAYIWLVTQRSGGLPMVAKGASAYGYVFWSVEDPQSVRMIAVGQDGRFNFRRLIPNGVFHAVGGWGLFDQLRAVFGAAYIRREWPFAGFVMLWAPWVGLAGYKVFKVIIRDRDRLKSEGMIHVAPQLVITASMGVILIFILSYGTITYRYKVEIWPVIWVLSLISLPALIGFLGAQSLKAKRLVTAAGIGLVMIGSGFSLFHAHEYTSKFTESKIWSFDECVGFLQVARTPLSLPESLCN